MSLVALGLIGLVISALCACDVAVDRRARRIERERHARDVAALERELDIGRPLAERLGDDPLAVAIEALPSPTPLGLHIDCLLRMGVITFAEWLVLADEHTPLTFTAEPRFDPPTQDDVAEASRRRHAGYL